MNRPNGSVKPNSSKMKSLIKLLMKRSKRSARESKPLVKWHEYELKSHMKDMKSDLEKAFYLMLRQEYYKNGDYVVIPNERVCVKNVCDLDKGYECEYEIDFAIYSGSKSKPGRIAIECDGLRSHGRRNASKDRLKDINLQANGWIIIRFGSREIHEEVYKQLNTTDALYRSNIIYLIERIVWDLQDSVVEGINQTDVRDLLTGYRSLRITCPSCGDWRIYRHTDKKFICIKCKHDLNTIAISMINTKR